MDGEYINIFEIVSGTMEHFELFPKNLKLNLEIVGHLVFPNTFMFWLIWPDSNLSFFFGGGE